MNRTQVRGVLKHLEIAKQFAEGKTIQYKDDGGRWHVTTDPALAHNVEYRIKPEPRRFWRVEFDNGNVWAQHSSEEAAKTNLNSLIGNNYIGVDKLRIVEYVEVMK